MWIYANEPFGYSWISLYAKYHFPCILGSDFSHSSCYSICSLMNKKKHLHPVLCWCFQCLHLLKAKDRQQLCAFWVWPSHGSWHLTGHLMELILLWVTLMIRKHFLSITLYNRVWRAWVWVISELFRGLTFKSQV